MSAAPRAHRPSLFDALEARSEAVAFTFPDAGGRALTFGALDERARRFAHALADRGLRPGDRVAVFAPSSAELIVALVAVLRAGLVYVPINTRYRGLEIDHILGDAGASLLLTTSGSPAAEVAHARGVPVQDIVAADADGAALDSGWASPEPGRDAVAMLIYTSGTTGRSKGVALTHGALTANIGATTSLWRWSGADRLALALPLFHVHGLGLGVLGTLLHGMRADVLARFDPDAVVALVAQGATIFMGVPTMYHQLLARLDADPAAAAALRRARLFTSGSAALPAVDFARFEAHTGHRILERYGMSETGFTLSNPYAGERRPGTVGRPVPGYEARLVDDADAPAETGAMGEIQVRGDGLMAGYWGDEAATAAAFTGDGWFRTGDVATLDPDGYFRIVGRRSADIIKSGGFKVGAREIEDVIGADPHVAEVAVIGVADPEWGERIEAVVVAAEGAPELTPAGWLELVRSRVAGALADYKRPRAVHVVDALPRNALGKVQKHVLKARLQR